MAHTKFTGSSSCFLFSLSPRWRIRRTNGNNSNFVWLQTTRGTYNGFPVGLGFGGTTDNFTVFIDEDLQMGKIKDSQLTFEKGVLLASEDFEVQSIEVWGCGGEDAEIKSQASASMKQQTTKSSGPESWSSNPDK